MIQVVTLGQESVILMMKMMKMKMMTTMTKKIKLMKEEKEEKSEKLVGANGHLENEKEIQMEIVDQQSLDHVHVLISSLVYFFL